MSSSQYPISRTIININQDDNLQKKKVQSYEYDRNRFPRQVLNDKTTQHAASSIYRNISGVGSNKILKVSHAEDQAASLVSQLPSLDSDGKNFESHRHILKIEISPRKNSNLIKSQNKIEKSSSGGDFNEVGRKMSVVSRISCNSSGGGKKNNKSVTIIKHEESHNGYEDGNLSDDQKLVVLTCNSGSRSEMIGNVGRIILSGHCSPCGGSGDSGTCSDVEVNGRGSISESPPPLPPKTYKIKMTESSLNTKLSESTCSDASSASSSDSMQYHHHPLVSPELIRTISNVSSQNYESSPTTRVVSFMLPTSLLQDIRNRSTTSSPPLKYSHHEENYEVEEEEEELRSENELMDEEDDDDELNYSDIVICRNNSNKSSNEKEEDDSSECNNKNNRSDNEFYDDDKFYKFHINENFSSLNIADLSTHEESDESFAGIKDLRSGTSTIRSSKGTIRGVKNRVRNGIATFQQQMQQQTTVKVLRTFLSQPTALKSSYT